MVIDNILVRHTKPMNTELNNEKYTCTYSTKEMVTIITNPWHGMCGWRRRDDGNPVEFVFIKNNWILVDEYRKGKAAKALINRRFYEANPGELARRIQKSRGPSWGSMWAIS